MRRRNQLQVNTFPFLAVLLCAMGSLILILLVMDRRARMAALQRGQDEAGRLVRERAEAIAARSRQNSNGQDELKVAWDRKKAELKARLDAEQRALDAETRQVQGRLAQIATELRGEEAQAGKLRTDLRTEQLRLVRHEQALEAARKEAGDVGGRLTAGDRARHKLAADTVQLEQIVRDLEAARKRDAMTYSVVPYKGKQGEKRRPIYVECGTAGVVFHPDRLTLAEPSVSAIQEEVARRVARLAEQRKKAGLNDERAYLLMLVRPNGIKRYYQVQSAIHDLPVEFGYEFVDEDWTLTVPEGVELAEASPEPVEAPKAVQLLPPAGEPSVRLTRPQPYNEGPALEPNPVGGETLPPLGTTNPPSVTRPVLPLAVLPESPAVAEQGPDLGPTAPRAFPLLEAKSVTPETVVFVECRSDGAVLYPSGKSFSIDSLNHSPAHNPLYQAAVAALKAGDPKSRAVRFLVHPDGERTFELASPAFNGVGATKTRHSLQPDDDISRLVGE